MQPSGRPPSLVIVGVDEKPFVSMGTSEEEGATHRGGIEGCLTGSAIMAERLSEAPLIDCRHDCQLLKRRAPCTGQGQGACRIVTGCRGGNCRPVMQT